MFKWVEIGLENNRPRYQALSDFLKNQGFENSVEFISTSAADFQKVMDEALVKYDGIRIGRGLSEIVVPMFNHQAATVQKIRAADAVVKEYGQWWLRANSVDGFMRVLTRLGDKFERESSVLVVGAGAAARVALIALFIVGFKNFSISSLDKKQVELLIKDLSRSLLGAKLTLVPKDGLVLLPGTHGVFVNTTPMTEDNAMLEELYYFNFFKQGGIAVDFSILPVDTILLKGAREIGAHCIYGYQISAHTDLIWCEQILGRSVDVQAYEDRLGEILRAENT